MHETIGLGLRSPALAADTAADVGELRALVERALDVLSDAVSVVPGCDVALTLLHDCRIAILEGPSARPASICPGHFDAIRESLLRQDAVRAAERRWVEELATLTRDALTRLDAAADALDRHSIEVATRMTEIASRPSSDIARHGIAELAALAALATAHRTAWDSETARLAAGIATFEERVASLAPNAADSLTGAVNREAFAAELLHAAEAVTASLAIALIDVDGLRRVNERAGRSAGDITLQMTAAALMGAVRQGDLVGRYGPDTFAVMLHNLTIAQAETCLTSALGAIAATPATGDAGESVSFTASCGLTARGPGDTPRSLIHRADDALRSAKRYGGGRLTTSEGAYARHLRTTPRNIKPR